MATQAKGLNVKSKTALRRLDVLLRSRQLPEGLVTSLFATKDQPTSVKPNTASTPSFLQPKDESYMTAQRQAAILPWLLCVQEELQRQNGSGSGRMLRGGIDSFPGYHHGKDE